MATRPQDNPFDPAYVKKRKPVLLIVLGVIAFAALAFTGMFFYISKTIKESGAYLAAITEVSSNEKVLEKIGGIREFETTPNGSIETEGDTGHAEFNMTIEGNIREIDLHVLLEKKPGENWAVTSINEVGSDEQLLNMEEPIEFEEALE